MSNFPVKVPTLEIYRGDSFHVSYVIKDSVSGEPRDLEDEGWTDWVAQWRSHTGSEVQASFVVDITDLSSGRVGVSMDAETTATIGRGVWDLQASQGDIVRTWLAGNVAFVKDVSRA